MGILSILGKVATKVIPSVGKKILGPLNIVSEIPSQSEAAKFAAKNGQYLTGTRKIVSGLGRFVKNELVVNPVARLKGAAARTALTLGAITGGTYAATGNFNLPSGRTTALVGATSVNPIAAGLGFLGSGGSDAVNRVSEKFMSSVDPLKNWAFPQPQGPVIGDVNVPNVDFQPSTSTIPDLAPQLQLSQPLNIQLPSSNVNVGGGPSMSDALLPLLLLTGAVGAGGYLLGRKKRKKKKSKKSKKRKRV